MLDHVAFWSNNGSMQIQGHVENGVIVLDGGAVLPEGTPVVIACALADPTTQTHGKRVKFPLVRSDEPGSINLTAERVADLLSEEDVAS